MEGTPASDVGCTVSVPHAVLPAARQRLASCMPLRARHVEVRLQYWLMQCMCMQNTVVADVSWLFLVLLLLMCLGRAMFVFPLSYCHNYWAHEKLTFKEVVVIWCDIIWPAAQDSFALLVCCDLVAFMPGQLQASLVHVPVASTHRQWCWSKHRASGQASCSNARQCTTVP